MSYLEYVQQNLDRGLQWYPGSQYQFSDTNYLILGILIDNLPLKDSIRYPAFVKKYILDPCGARDSYIEEYGSLTTPGYEFHEKSGTWAETRPPAKLSGYSARSLISTAHDLILLDAGLRRILTSEDASQMWAPTMQVCTAQPQCTGSSKSCYCDKVSRTSCQPGLSFGMGWYVTPECTHMIVKLPGFSGILYYDKSHRKTVVLLTNLGSSTGERHADGKGAVAPFMKIARRVVELSDQAETAPQLPLTIEGFAPGPRQRCIGLSGVVVPLIMVFIMLAAFYALSGSGK